ncbi:hypothetical protein G3F99_003841 [Salmonella enterica subsp. enterica]|nr:hypothetical protein [Salmonella enterica subsp. enterica]
MIRNIFKRFTNQTFRCPRPGQWYTTPAGHVLRVSLVVDAVQKMWPPDWLKYAHMTIQPENLQNP